VKYAGGPKAPKENTPDEQWLKIAGDNDWVVITRDKRLRRRRGERKIWMKRGLRVFVMSSSGNMTAWETLQLLVERFDEIEDYARDRTGPYIVSVTKTGLHRLEPKEN
jgi:uncharacterized protein with PIN domain